MDPAYRTLFNEAYSDDLYARYQEDLTRRVGIKIGFRLAETPFFLPEGLREKLVSAGEAILETITDRANIEKMSATVPDRWKAPNPQHLPSFACFDFAIVRDEDGSLGPRLIELQAFPSLSCFEILQSDSWNAMLDEIEGLDGTWTSSFSDLDRDGLVDLVRRTMIGDCDPKEVIIVDLDPPSQKTACDFWAAEHLLGVSIVDARRLVASGGRLWRPESDSDRLVPVRRIHNRIIFDELERKGVTLPVDFREDFGVEWANHPDWYWIWSKSSLPYLHHPTVPKLTLLSELEVIPDHLLEQYVLKPLYSFAGLGVNIDPMQSDIDAIPEDQRPFWCVQEKINYEPALAAADGWGVKAEIRMMYYRTDDSDKMILGQNLVRLSRGKMLGVDFNKDFTWVGSSIGIYQNGTR